MNELELLKSSVSDLEWLRENMDRIKENYEGEVIAIKDKKIVCSAPNSDILFRKLDKKGIEQEEVMIKYIPTENELIIL